MKKEPVVLIGFGRVGQTLARLLPQAGYPIAAIGARNPERLRDAAQTLSPRPVFCSIRDAAQHARIVLLAVRDDAIASVAQQCAFPKGASVIHFSGMLDSRVLSAACASSASHAASMHPLQTFAAVEQAVRDLPNSCCVIEGDAPAVQTALHLAEALALIPMVLQPDSKPLYHAAAVMACGGLTALLHAVEQVAATAGIPRETMWQAFSPLIQNTLRNVREQGAAQALTGPVARGDIQTIQSHLQALAALPDEQALYQAVTDYAARRIAEKKPN